MRFSRFEDIIAWQEALDLTVLIYQYMNNYSDYGFKSQIQRASVSIMNNIAEGFERQTNNEFRHFLYIAKGSCGEVRSMLILARKLQTIETEIIEKLLLKSENISKMLAKLIKTL
ncbi:MAG: four helix bundle protein [Bacteroidales bacterium]|nr:four helix bundle protein [Bacteroidales bacterium]